MSAMEPADRLVIACNYREGTNVASAGARAWVSSPNYGGGHDRVRVLVRSRGGRLVHKYENIKRLTSFRIQTIPVDHPRYADERLWSMEREDLEPLVGSLEAASESADHERGETR